MVVDNPSHLQKTFECSSDCEIWMVGVHYKKRVRYWKCSTLSGSTYSLHNSRSEWLFSFQTYPFRVTKLNIWYHPQHSQRCTQPISLLHFRPLWNERKKYGRPDKRTRWWWVDECMDLWLMEKDTCIYLKHYELYLFAHMNDYKWFNMMYFHINIFIYKMSAIIYIKSIHDIIEWKGKYNMCTSWNKTFLIFLQNPCRNGPNFTWDDDWLEFS